MASKSFTKSYANSISICSNWVDLHNVVTLNGHPSKFKAICYQPSATKPETLDKDVKKLSACYSVKKYSEFIVSSEFALWS